MENILSQALGQDAAQLASEEKRLLLSRLLARLAHEVRNPLSALDIHVQLLQEDLHPLTGPVRDRTSARLEIIRGELSRLENIVERFLRLAGPSSLELESVSPRQLCERVCQLVQPEAQSHQTALHLQVDAETPKLQADADQLTQALLNLVINALQAVETGGVVTVRVHQPTPELVALDVSDTGPGVPEASRTSIFDPFFTTKRNGTGLGLWIAQQIVLAHGGTLQVAAATGGGALFSLRLPLNRPASANG
ncbi:MAG TPA: ATP-binding protein [Dongiaceae bacterium]|nr:ATP-binding protein [Dongiaceae bacterium]